MERAASATRWGSDAARPSAGQAVVDIAAFAAEIAMLVLLALSGWDFGNGGLLGIALAVFYPALAITVWAIWVAPSSRHRLGDPARLALQVAMFAATGIAVGVAGHTVVAVIFPVLATVVFALTRSFGTERLGELAADRSVIAIDDDEMQFDDFGDYIGIDDDLRMLDDN
jgi:hypothetical protein